MITPQSCIEEEKPISLYAFLWMTFSFLIGWRAVTPILPLYSIDLGASILLTGIIISMSPAIMLMTNIPFGMIVQRIKSTWLLVFLYIIQIIGFTLLASAWNTVMLVVAVGLYGLVSSFFLPVSSSISLSRTSRANRGTVVGKYYTAIGGGMLVGPLLTGFLIEYLSYRELFTFLIIFPVSGLTILIYNITRKRSFPSIGRRLVGFRGSIKRVFSDTSITVLFIVTLFFALPIGTFNTLFPIHATSSLGFTASTVSILFAVRGGFNVLVREPSGVLSDHIGRKRILTAVFIFAMISFIILAFSSDVYMIAAAMAVFGIAWGIRPPVLSAAIGDRLPIDLIPLAMAMYYTSISTGFMVGSLIAGFMGGRYPWHIIMVPYILLAAASAMLIVKIFKEKVSENSNLKTNMRMNE